jgi:TPR repeat protein
MDENKNVIDEKALLAAGKGDVDAQYYCAMFLLSESASEEDHEKALSHLFSAAENNHPPSLFFLGTLYTQYTAYKIVDPDPGKALEFFRRAADLWYGDAVFVMAGKYHTGDGVPQDRAKARESYEMVKPRSPDNAMPEVGVIHFKDLWCDPVEPREAIKRLRKTTDLSSLSDLSATFNLARLLETGKGVDKDPVKAVKLLTRAADAGHVQSQVALAEIHLQGVIVPKDVALAFKYFHMAAERGHPDSLRNLGVLTLAGEVVMRNVPLGLSYLHQAADLGNAQALFTLGNFHFGDGGVQEIDFRAAAGFFRRAAKLRHTESLIILQVLYERHPEFMTGEPDEMRKLKGEKRAKRTADQMHAAAQWMSMLDDLLRAAEGGDVEARFKFGMRLFTRGRMGDGRGQLYFPFALASIKQAAENGHLEAQFQLGRIIYKGRNTEKNIDEGLKWIRKAAENGHAKAQDFLKKKIGSSLKCDLF